MLLYNLLILERKCKTREKARSSDTLLKLNKMHELINYNPVLLMMAEKRREIELCHG